jgi:hypothetical protein
MDGPDGYEGPDKMAPVSLPEIPFPKSDMIRAVRWLGEQVRDSSGGYTWSTTKFSVKVVR